MVETESSIPSRAYCSLCRLTGWWLAYFSTSIIASRLGPAKPRAMAWNGAGGCVIVSQERRGVSWVAWSAVIPRPIPALAACEPGHVVGKMISSAGVLPRRILAHSFNASGG
jgi:hypothetical protein